MVTPPRNAATTASFLICKASHYARRGPVEAPSFGFLPIQMCLLLLADLVDRSDLGDLAALDQEHDHRLLFHLAVGFELEGLG